jgi:excinuclease UvrABC helicase subunit UvrB
MFDGEKEVRRISGFIDGVILAKIFACPIYTNGELMEKYASAMDIVSEKIVKKEIHLQKLKEELANAVAAEDYEKAAKINRAIEELNKENPE